MPEQLAGAEQIEHAPVGDDLDGAVPDHPQVLEGAVALSEDRRLGRQPLQLGGRRKSDG